MKKISYMVKKGLMAIAFTVVPLCSMAQINISNSADEIVVKKHVPVTDGSVNMYFGYGQYKAEKNNIRYDNSLQAIIDFYKAFIGQKLLFFGGSGVGKTGFLYAKRQIIDCKDLKIVYPDGVIPNSQNIIHKLSTRNIYDYSSDIYVYYVTRNSITYRNRGIKAGSIINIKKFTAPYRKDCFNQFFELKDVLSFDEMINLMQKEDEEIYSERRIHPKLQKKWEKLEKKKEKGNLTHYDDSDYKRFINGVFSYFTNKVGEETFYSKNIKGDTLIDNNTKSFNDRKIVFLVADANGTEYFIQETTDFRIAAGDYNRLPNGTGQFHITDKHLDFLKKQFVGQDFARMRNGKIISDIFHCEDLVLRDDNLMAKCLNTKTNETIYLNIRYGRYDGYYLYERSEEYINVVL